LGNIFLQTHPVTLGHTVRILQPGIARREVSLASTFVPKTDIFPAKLAGGGCALKRKWKIVLNGF
jgi:hypothetical protein